MVTLRWCHTPCRSREESASDSAVPSLWRGVQHAEQDRRGLSPRLSIHRNGRAELAGSFG